MMEPATEVLYSITQASQQLGKSETTIKSYKKLVLEAFQKEPSLVTVPNGSLTEYGLEQLRKAGHFIQKGDKTGYLKAIFQANPSLQFDISEGSQPTQATSGNSRYTGVLTGGSLVKRRSTAISNSVAGFDEAAASQELAAIEADTLQQVDSLDGVLRGFAKARFRRALINIDHTIAAMESNAMSEVGATVAGDARGEATNSPKPQSTPQTADAS